MKWYRFLIILCVFLSSCAEEDSQSFNDEVKSSGESVLYVASGTCYAGGVTTLAGANTVTSFNTKTGQKIQVVIDYNEVQPGDIPVGVDEYDSDYIIVLVENAAGRRVDLVKKDGSEVIIFSSNTTALSAQGRKVRVSNDGSGVLVSKSTAIEKFSHSRARITQGANPYINAPAGACATSTTLISDFVQLSNSKHAFVHAAASPNNKIAIISATGYAAGGDCLSAQAAPATTALPTGILRHSSGRLLVTYASTTLASNFIYSYDINETTNVFSNITNAYTNTGIVNGPSAITEDTSTGEVYVAVGNSSYNTIEKFNYNSTTRLLTRIGGTSFISPSAYTRCVASMKVGTR